MKYILSRTNDYEIHSKKWIVGYGLLFWLLCVISVPFFAGCAITYYRINLGVWWGVGLHIFNNLPAIFVMLSI